MVERVPAIAQRAPDRNEHALYEEQLRQAAAELERLRAGERSGDGPA